MVKAEAFKEYLEVYSKEYGLVLDERRINRYTRFYENVVTTNEVMNLTAITEPKEFVLKHIIDSLSAYDERYMVEHASILDLGTGAGFPGIPLKIYKDSFHMTLFDSLKKRLTFLDGVIKDLGLEYVKTLHGRAEDLSHTDEHRESYDIVTSRAVARLPILLEWALPYCKVGGYFVALKGMLAEEEIKDSTHALNVLGGKIIEIKEIKLPTLDDMRSVIYIEKIKESPLRYPRKPKEIKEKPL